MRLWHRFWSVVSFAHSAVADEADVLDPEPLTHRGDGVGNGLLVGDVSLMHAHRDRKSTRLNSSH